MKFLDFKMFMCKIIKNQSEFICTIPFWYRYVNIFLENKINNCYTFKGIFVCLCSFASSCDVLLIFYSVKLDQLQKTPEQ